MPSAGGPRSQRTHDVLLFFGFRQTNGGRKKA